MPARKNSKHSPADFAPDKNIVPADLDGDDALWMLLNAYADGEATPEEVARVESLLGTHPGVAREFQFLQLTTDSVRQFGEIDPPDRLAESIFAATARKKTLFQRVCAVWAKAGAIFEPAPLRIAATALASGIVVMVMWSKFGGHKSVSQPDHAPQMVSNSVTTPAHRNAAALASPASVQHHDVAIAPRTPFVQYGPERIAAIVPPVDHGQISVQPVSSKTIERGSQTGPALAANTSQHIAAPPKVAVAPDPQPAAVPAPRTSNVEERHMVADNDAAANGGKSVDLGPDVDTGSDVHPEEVAMVTPAVATDEPPTATVAPVSYRPGSISDKSRNAPPAVQSLYMRTQEAIRRQHEIQQYGGYDKDTFNNIQRREVGLSLVGGRF